MAKQISCCSTPQINTWSSDWIQFYGERRLGYQLKLALDQYGDRTIYEKGNLYQELLFFPGLILVILRTNKVEQMCLYILEEMGRLET